MGRGKSGYRRIRKIRIRENIGGKQLPGPVYKGLIVLCAAVFAFSAFQLIRYAADSARTKRENASLAQLHRETAAEETPETPLTALPPENTPAPTDPPASRLRPEVSATPTQRAFRTWAASSEGGNAAVMKRFNRDYCFWLKVEGEIDLPVVYRDNVYYLDHAFYGGKANSGTLFLDEYSPLTPETQQLIVHGHNMKDGSMFGRLNHYERASYAKTHAFASVETAVGTEEYVLFAAAIAEVRDGALVGVPYVSYPTFPSDRVFDSYISRLKQASFLKIPVDVEAGDALLTLSTCEGDDRLIVCFRRVRPGETKEELQKLVNSVRTK